LLPLIVGTENISRAPLETDQKKILLRKYLSIIEKYGLVGIDTAECYGSPQIEKMLGSMRQLFQGTAIDTKFGHENVNGQIIERFDYVEVKTQLQQSIQNLKWINTYYFHSGDNKHFKSKKLWVDLNSYLASGIICNLGLSIKNELVIENDLTQIELMGRYNIRVLQIVLNPIHKSALNIAIPMAKDMGVKIRSRVVLSKGDIVHLSFNEIFQMTNNPSIILDITDELRKIQELMKYEYSLDHIQKIACIFHWNLNIVDEMIIASLKEKNLKLNIEIVKLLKEKTLSRGIKE
jgi:diketogulonate reductase-like aldo/keto reductase